MLPQSPLIHLKDLKQLSTLDLTRCHNITDEGLKHLKDLPLKNLNLGWCDKITDAGLEHLKDLRQLYPDA